MAVIPSSQLDLCRQRKLMATALHQHDWSSIKALDSELCQSVAGAADDPSRDLALLLKELRVVVGLYRSILSQCDLSARDLAGQLLK